jgi:hypothetical protein
LYFGITNDGAALKGIVVDSGIEAVKVDLGGLSSGAEYPVSVQINITGGVMVYPEGCKEVNFKNISFEPND